MKCVMRVSKATESLRMGKMSKKTMPWVQRHDEGSGYVEGIQERTFVGKSGCAVRWLRMKSTSLMVDVYVGGEGGKDVRCDRG